MYSILIFEPIMSSLRFKEINWKPSGYWCLLHELTVDAEILRLKVTLLFNSIRLSTQELAGGGDVLPVPGFLCLWDK